VLSDGATERDLDVHSQSNRHLPVVRWSSSREAAVSEPECLSVWLWTVVIRPARNWRVDTAVAAAPVRRS